ncbi:uncharacterized protein LOC115734373 [Rhodamnia argentea]|uniref:Uncharacterized protein LOC115734373 n=1 Tax=Rhodamnia argentea TaxID=178133 RepID=A0ABM3HJA7_9MYRT|nr:uncharacterized protein LOC115734373 [Rhodamnia argentea]
MNQVIQKLHEKSNFTEIHYENPPIGIVAATTPTAGDVDSKEDVLESRAKIMEDVMKAVADDKVSVVGVWGAGGVGKSKLLEDIERKIKEQKLFDVVTTAQVSRNPDLKRIQGEIAYALGLKLTNEEPTRVRADRLCTRLKNDSEKKILIILDNLWKKLELKEVGIPFGDDNKVRGCKLLLTSRNLEVLRSDMGSDRHFQLNELKDREARILFERTIGDRVNDPKVKPLVDGVVQKCGGLPLLILSVAKRLKDGDLAEWRNALTKIEGSDVESIVEQNYNDLKDDRMRSLFLVCALSSGRIRTGNILFYGMGLGLFKTFAKTIESIKDRFKEDLHILQRSSLLLDSDVTEEIQMHDIFVDVAISIASKEWNALVAKKNCGFKEWTKDELKKCTAMSFPWVGIDELPEEVDCPNLKMLLLLEDNPSLKIPELFFQSMEKLQVLELVGLSFSSLPSSIEFLENLKSLCLDNCHLGDVTLLGKLKGLQCLSFSDSSITQLPKEIGGLTELRILSLVGCSNLKVIGPGVLGSLVRLEELRMENSFDQWEDEDQEPRSNASLAELKNMKNLSTLSISIPRSVNLSGDLPFGNLNEYIIQIGDVWDWSDEVLEDRNLKLKPDSGKLLDEEWVQRCLRMTQDLHLDGLQDGHNSIHSLCEEGFQELLQLHVRNSPSLQYIVHSTEYDQCKAFTKLEKLFLENLNNLEKICHGCLAPESFSKLKIVKVKNCHEIKHLFPSPMMRILLQLEEIEITTCHLMQQLVGNAEADEYINEIDEDANTKSCKLRRLMLQNLPEMTSLCKTRDHSVAFFNEQQVSLPWLESMTLSHLPKLEDIWNSQFPSDVTNLKFLKVEDCAFLLSIFPSNLVIKLQNLEAIAIERCHSIREVFNLEGQTANEDVEVLSRLTILTLSDLPRLGHIWSKNPRIGLCFRNLRAPKVQNCENLRFLFSSSTAKTLHQIKEIEIASCKLLEEIIDAEEEESKEAASIDTLQFPMLTSLTLEELPNLRTFAYGMYRIHCPTLTRPRISGCPKMMTFSSFEEKKQSTRADTDLQQGVGGVNSSLSLPILFDQNVLFPSLEELTLVSMFGLMKIWHNELSEESFRKLASITIQDCENLSHIFPSASIDRFQSLKMIEVVKCASLEALIKHIDVNTNERQRRLVFSDFKEMKLWDLPRLNAFVTSSTKATLSLPSLTNVSLRNCHSLRCLFTNDTSRTLDKLEMLDVFGCNNMQDVVPKQESGKRKLKAVKFSHLHTLKLSYLKRLVSFSSGSCPYEFPSLRKLTILECTELKAFILRQPATNAGFDESPHSLFDEKVVFPKLEELRLTGIQSRGLWENEMPDESICHLKVLEVKQFPNLLNVIPSFMGKRLLRSVEYLTVEECPCVRNLFTMSMAKSLVQLQYLVLGGCGEIEYIVAREEERLEEVADIIAIPQLVTLYLHNMPKLKSFCNGKSISEWPSLKWFTVEDCKAVEVILGDASCNQLEGSVPTKQPLLLVDQVEFPNMELMKISHMNNVEKIWVDELALNAFSKLKMLIVEYCEKLSSIFSSESILARFQNLEKLVVTYCGSLEVAFQVQELSFSQAHSTSTFQMREIVLIRLPNMKQMWSGLPRPALTFGQLRTLKAVGCESLKSLFPSSVAKNMTQLENLEVTDCGVEEIIAEEDGGAGTSAEDLFFPRLTYLWLFDLPKLRSFHRNSHTSTWPLLKNLQLKHCGQMRSFAFASEIQSWQGTTINQTRAPLFCVEKVIPQLEQLPLAREDVEMMQHYIFGNLKELALICHHDANVAFPTNFLLQRFPNLETLIVHCSSFEEIFPEDAFGHRGATPSGGLSDIEKPLKAIGNLKRLELRTLWNLKQVWKDGSLLAEILQQIEYLHIGYCPSISIVFPSPTSLQSLTGLQVENCNGLVHMGTCSAMTSLVHLKSLALGNCPAMEDVVTDDGKGVKEISFPKLQWLKLDDLPSLESFSATNSTFMFPSLMSILVTRCPKMNIFCKGALRTPVLDKVFFSYQDSEGHWEVTNLTIDGRSSVELLNLIGKSDPMVVVYLRRRDWMLKELERIRSHIGLKRRKHGMLQELGRIRVTLDRLLFSVWLWNEKNLHAPLRHHQLLLWPATSFRSEKFTKLPALQRLHPRKAPDLLTFARTLFSAVSFVNLRRLSGLCALPRSGYSPLQEELMAEESEEEEQ